MFKKLVTASIAASLLLSIPLSADHHHHHDRIRETIIEVKAKDKSGGEKVAGGLLQFVNKTSALWAGIASMAIGYYGPHALNASQSNLNTARAIEGIISFVVLYPTIKYGTAAVMSQEDIKPLRK